MQPLYYNLTDSYRGVQRDGNYQAFLKRTDRSSSLDPAEMQVGTGTQLTVEETEDGVLLRPAKPFPPTTVDELIAILEKKKFRGKPKTLAEMDDAIAIGVRRRRARGRY